MQKYADWRPTPWDTPGRYMPEGEEYGEWFVAPWFRTRDSEGPSNYYDSNFHVALEKLGGESDTVAVIRHGHWGPGWIEIILVHPSRVAELEALEDKAEIYPLLDEEDYSNRKWGYALKWWNNGDVRHRLAIIQEYNARRESWERKVSPFAARRGWFPQDDERFLE